ncbi:MAG: fatty acid desaturase [Pseudomonadota bacterium]|nr:fatty acid desaturase [Pseudomonadota bacterium]
MLNGFLDLPVWSVVLVMLLMTHVTSSAITIYLHRHQAHRALDLNPALAHFFRLWLWLTTGMVTREWVAVHRKHHAKCETEEDPHSPQIYGLPKVLFMGAFLYRTECENTQTIQKYGHAAPNDWLEKNLYNRFNWLGVVLMLAIDLFLFGLLGLVVWGVQMIWTPFWAAGVINGVGHYLGYRNFECKDASTNIVPIGLLMAGEELHNNHHAFPSSAKFSQRRWEFDLGWFYIRLLQAVGLARVKKVSPRPHLDPARTKVDGDTVQAVFINRMHLLADYARKVTIPVLRDQSGEGREIVFGEARRLLVRERGLLDEHSSAKLTALLKDNTALRTVYQFRERLQSIWESTGASQEHALVALREWCAHAEATGLEALHDFSQRVRSYALSAPPRVPA